MIRHCRGRFVMGDTSFMGNYHRFIPITGNAYARILRLFAQAV